MPLPRPVRIARLAALLAALLAAAPRIAAAHPAELDQAVHALDELRYEDAARLLDQAYRTGDNGPDDLRLLFRLQGEVAATLGDDAGARAAFARYWSLAPDERLPAGTSPKITTAFDAALAGMAGRKPFAAHHELSGHALVLVVDSDPAGLAAGARAAWRGEGGVRGVVEQKGAGRVELPLPDGELSVTLSAIDGHGNRLVELGPIAVAHATGALPHAHAPGGGGTPVYASPWLWGGAGVAALGTGVAFAWLASRSQDELDALDADSTHHSFSEAALVEDRLRRRALIANVSFGAAAVLGGVSVWLAMREHHRHHDAPRAGVGVAPGPGAAGLSVEVRF
jgi:hypothetical protein